MKIAYLAIVPALFTLVACGGSNPEPETPATAEAAATEAKPAEGEAKPAEGEAKPAEGEAKPAEGDAPAGEEKK